MRDAGVVEGADAARRPAVVARCETMHRARHSPRRVSRPRAPEPQRTGRRCRIRERARSHAVLPVLPVRGEPLAVARARARAVRVTLDWFRALMDSAPEVYFRYAFAPARRFAYVSRAVEPLTGHTADAFYADPAFCVS